MPTRIFAITAARETVTLDNQGRAEVSFTASNTGPKPIAGRAKLVAIGSTKEGWLSLDGQHERKFAKGEAHQFTVKVAAPPGTPAGKYAFRLDIISVENPDEEFTEGPSVLFEVKELAAAKPPPRKFPWWIVAVAGVLVLGASLIIWLLIPQKITVPDMVGMPYEEAVKTLEAAKLKLTAKQKPGIVIEQSPKAKETAPVGSGVTLVVEVAPEMVTVPDVINIPVDKVAPMFQGKLAYQVNDQRVITGKVPIGAIANQSPAAGQSVPVGTKVMLTAEAESVQVPRLIDRSQGEVGPTLKAARLQLRTEAKSAGAKPGTIVDQNPKPDERVAPDTMITAFVEPEPEMITVPDVIGFPVEKVDPMLKGARLRLRTEPKSAGEKPGTPGTIVDQNPKPNERVAPGTIITAFVEPKPEILRGHGGSVTAVAISNRWVVTGSDDQTARLWDLSAKDPAANPVVLRGYQTNVQYVAISRDNRWAVTGGEDNPKRRAPDPARLWDLRAKDPAVNPVELHQPVRGLAISPDNRWLAAGGIDGTARLWDLSAKDPAANPVVLRGSEEPVSGVAISPDSHWVVTGGGSDNTARLWDLSAKDPAANPVVLHGGPDAPIWAVAISNRWVVTGSGLGTVRLWDLSAKDPAANPVVLPAVVGGRRMLVTAVAISPDNHWVAAGSDRTARLWDLSAKDPAANPVDLPGHVSWVIVAITPDSHWLFTGSGRDNTARLWDLNAKDPAANPVVLRGHEAGISAVAISPDSRWIVTGSADHTARLWDLGKPPTF